MSARVFSGRKGFRRTEGNLSSPIGFRRVPGPKVLRMIHESIYAPRGSHPQGPMGYGLVRVDMPLCVVLLSPDCIRLELAQRLGSDLPAILYTPGVGLA